MLIYNNYTNKNSKKKDIFDLYEEADIENFRSHLTNSMDKSLKLKSYYLSEGDPNYEELIKFRSKTFRISA